MPNRQAYFRSDQQVADFWIESGRKLHLHSLLLALDWSKVFKTRKKELRGVDVKPTNERQGSEGKRSVRELFVRQ